MIDHRSYTHNLSSCEIKASKKGLDLNGIRCSALSTELSSHLEAGPRWLDNSVDRAQVQGIAWERN